MTACVPLTAYRATGLVPAAQPIAWDGVPAAAHSFHVEASLDHAQMQENLVPVEHDTALLVPQTTADLTMGFAPVEGVELGLRGTYAAYSWGQATAVGTMPIPGQLPTWGLGPEIRVAIRPSDNPHFALGFAGNAIYTQVPYAEWQLGDCSSGDTCTTGTGYSTTGGTNSSAQYRLLDQGTDAMWVFSFGVYPSYSFGDHAEFGTLTLSLTAHSTFANDGFDDNPPGDSGKPSVSGLMPMAGAGYSIRFANFKMGLMAFVPLLNDQGTARELPGAMLTAGFDFGGRPKAAN